MALKHIPGATAPDGSAYVTLTTGSGNLSGSSAATIAVGVTGITGGTNNNVLFDNNGLIGEVATTGTGNVVRATSPTLTTPTINSPNLSVPYFIATRATTQTITSGAWTKIQFSSEISDSHNWYDPTTNFRFTPQQAGRYLINLGMYIAPSGGSITAIFGGIYKNGALVSQFGYNLGSAIGAGNGVYASKIISLNGTTDYVEGWVNCTSTGTIAVQATESQSWLEGHYIAT